MAYVRRNRSTLQQVYRVLSHERGTVVLPAPGRPGMASCLAGAIFCLLAVDAFVRFPGRLDLETMKLVQRIDHPDLGPNLEIFERLTDSSGAVLAWAVTLGLFAACRWWVPVLGCLALPLGGLVNETISRVLIHRTRPHLEELRHVSSNFEERSFPSGHVVGAVLLYGFIWYVAGRRIPNRLVVAAVRAFAVLVIGVTGFDRVWSGAHWPSDVVGAYALGYALLAALIAACRWADNVLERLRPASPGGTLLS